MQPNRLPTNQLAVSPAFGAATARVRQSLDLMPAQLRREEGRISRQLVPPQVQLSRPMPAAQVSAAADRLTRASLTAWQNSPHLTSAEREQRVAAVTIILQAAKVVYPGASRSDKLDIDGSVYLADYDKLTELPAELTRIGGNLILTGCKRLRRLPVGLSVGGDLNCRDCTDLSQLPERLIVEGTLDCKNCVKFVLLPDNLYVRKDFDCSGCINLDLTQEALRVDGDLLLNGCKKLMRLPVRLNVGGDLFLIDCIALTYLAEGMGIGGNLYCTDCVRLARLPADIVGWGHKRDGQDRVIILTGTALFRDLQQRLETTKKPGIKFYFSTPPQLQPQPQPQPQADAAFANLSFATAFWNAQRPELYMPDLSQWRDVDTQDQDQLRRFLGRVSGAVGERQQVGHRPLAVRVHRLLQTMDKNRDLRRRCIDSMRHALLKQGVDRMWVFKQVEDAMWVTHWRDKTNAQKIPH